MSFTKDSAVDEAKKDLAQRLGVDADKIAVRGVTEREFPDMSLGLPVDDELAAQMIATGWSIELEADGKSYEYRGDRYQLRLAGPGGSNHLIAG